MGFEKLADLREQLRAQAQQAAPVQPKQADRAKKRESAKKREPSRKQEPARTREPVDPTVEAIWRLQKQFPLAFPKNPAPKVPLKEGILADAAQHLEALSMTEEQLKQAIAAWCKGSRYWACLTEDAPRVDLQGQPVGKVTAQQAAYARRQASRRPGDKPRPAKKPAAPQAAAAPSVEAQPAVEQTAATQAAETP
ncbi:MAG: ProQ/FINO family protein [Achromobacter sp.]|uniref:ProQ/FinO family protein n=1 Tax=Achromobacter sp. TaxID=134375 RepID=UPI002589D667|nr:ProQ/FINO family protein [Achromobacter sp.]MCW0209911.1 ProQ/FINO family protein [Achromobacter sp.]